MRRRDGASEGRDGASEGERGGVWGWWGGGMRVERGSVGLVRGRDGASEGERGGKDRGIEGDCGVGEEEGWG